MSKLDTEYLQSVVTNNARGGGVTKTEQRKRGLSGKQKTERFRHEEGRVSQR